MSTILRKIRLIDPWRDIDQCADISWQDDQPALVDDHVAGDGIDASGLWLMPGFVDLGHQLPDGGSDCAASITSELAAAHGNGFSLVCCAPGTGQAFDTAAAIRATHKQAEGAGSQLVMLGALTRGLAGEQLADMAMLQAAGCVGVSQGDASLPPAALLRQAMRYAADLDLSLHLSARTAGLDSGCAHDGALSNALGLSGISVASETVAVSVLLALIEDTGCRVHVRQLSSVRAAEMLAEARQRGLPVSADVAIWNLVYDERAINGYDSRFHLSPPLRTERDREGLARLLASGDIQAISSGHRPLGADAKFAPFAETRPGASSIDGYLARLLQLHDEGLLSVLDLARCSARSPDDILHSQGHGMVARSWIVVDPAHQWLLDDSTRLSHADNHPLLGQAQRGAVAGWFNAQGLAMFKPWQSRHGV